MSLNSNSKDKQMFKGILKAISRLLHGDLDKVVAKFSKTLAKLEKVVEFHNQEASESRAAIAFHQNKAAQSEATAVRANQVKQNISNLLGV